MPVAARLVGGVATPLADEEATSAYEAWSDLAGCADVVLSP